MLFLNNRAHNPKFKCSWKIELYLNKCFENKYFISYLLLETGLADVGGVGVNFCFESCLAIVINAAR